MSSPRPDAAAALAAFLAKGKTITRVTAADADTVKAASREGWKLSLKVEAVASGIVKEVSAPYFNAENYAERQSEHYMECALSGVSQETAIEDWNYMNGNGSGRCED
jgi:hypothetical protein